MRQAPEVIRPLRNDPDVWVREGDFGLGQALIAALELPTPC